MIFRLEPKRKPKVRHPFALSPDVLDAFRSFSKEQGYSMSYLVEFSMRKMLNEGINDVKQLENNND